MVERPRARQSVFRNHPLQPIQCPRIVPAFEAVFNSVTVYVGSNPIGGSIFRLVEKLAGDSISLAPTEYLWAATWSNPFEIA